MDAPNGSGPGAPRQGTGAGSESSHPKGTATRRRAQAGRAGSASPRNGATLQRSRREDETTPEQLRAEAWEACKEIAHQPRILDCLISDLEKVGLVGETRAAKLIYLVLTSRLLDRPLCAVVKGPSSAGKSFLIEQVLKFFPPSAFHQLTGMSEMALAYGKEPLKHRVLVVAEAAGLSTGMGAYLLRSLISEGRIRYETVVSSNGLKPLRIEREGPTGLLITTTKLHLEAQLETRLFSIPVDDTPAQTRAIMLATADEWRGQKADLGPWRALQEWLGETERRVTVPFARKLAQAIPPVAVRLRRDFLAILRLIRIHALLHQTNRERDAEGRVIATLDDYADVRELVEDLVSEGVGATVASTVRETVEAVRAAKSKSRYGVPLPRIAKALKLDKSVVSRRVNNAIEMGYLHNEEARKGRPARIVLGEPLPEEVQVLPPPEALQCCGVAGGGGSGKGTGPHQTVVM